MHYFIPPQIAFHQEKMKHLSFLWFLFRHPAGDSSQSAIYHRMAASWTHFSAGEQFVFWKLHSAPSGYSSHPNLTHWSNMGCQHHICKYQICKYKNEKYLNLWAWSWHKKCTDLFFPQLSSHFERPFPPCYGCHVEEKAFTNPSYWLLFSAVVSKVLCPVLCKCLQVMCHRRPSGCWKSHCGFRARAKTWFAPIAGAAVLP